MKHTIKKRYHAFVYGSLPDDRGTIDRPIGRSKSDFRKQSSSQETRGDRRDAVTRWFTLLKGSATTFVEAQPITGRTHQIRVHFHAIGYPIVADPLYAPHRKSLFGFQRLALHARSVTFRVPPGGDETVEAPYPDDFTNAIKAFEESGAKKTAWVARLKSTC